MRLIISLWLAFVIAISMMPLKLKYRVGTTGVFHTPGHFVVFLITSILVCRNAPNSGSRLLRWAGVCCFAVALEILEVGMYHNRMEWRDVLVDVLGAAAGLALLSTFPAPSARVQNSEI